MSVNEKYVVNLIFLHRFTLQVFPSIPTRGNHPLNLIAHIYMFSVVPLLILVIVPGVQLFLSSDLSTIQHDRTILRFAQVYLTVFVAIQVPLIIFVWTKYILSNKSQHKHGANDTSTGIVGQNSPNSSSAGVVDLSPREVTIRATIIFTVASLLTWIQAIKICQGFYTPGPTTALNPPWFLRKPILYAGLFLPELLIVIIFAVSGIRKRFLKPVRGEGSKVEENGLAEGKKEGHLHGEERLEGV
jgi:hypothetical protein